MPDSAADRWVTLPPGAITLLRDGHRLASQGGAFSEWTDWARRVSEFLLDYDAAVAAIKAERKAASFDDAERLPMTDSSDPATRATATRPPADHDEARSLDPDEEALRAAVSRQWAEDWDSEEDSTYDR